MKALKKFGLFPSILIAGFLMFGVVRYVLSPRLTAASLCKAEQACLHGLSLGEKGVGKLMYSADGRFLFGQGVGGARLWNVQEKYKAERLAGSSVRSVALAADGRYAVAKDDGEVELFDIEGKELLEFSTLGEGLENISSMVFTPGYDMLVMPAPGEERSKTVLSFWSTRDGRFVSKLPHDSAIWSLSASEQGVVAAGQHDGKIVLWPVADFRNYRVLDASETFITELAFGAGGNLLASGDFEGDVKLWSTVTGEPIKSFQHTDSPVSGLSLSADGTLLVAAYSSGSVVVWNRDTDELLARWHYPRDVAEIALSPDAGQLAIALAHKVEFKTRWVRGHNGAPGYRKEYEVVRPAAVLIRDVSAVRAQGEE